MGLRLGCDLTPAEKRVIKKLWEHGANRKAVQEDLCIAECTLKEHLQNLYDKLQVNGLPQLLVRTGVMNDVVI